MPSDARKRRMLDEPTRRIDVTEDEDWPLEDFDYDFDEDYAEDDADETGW